MEAAERRATVLKAVVEEYVRTAQPVASQTITDSRDLGVSSATVRNDMTQLERSSASANSSFRWWMPRRSKARLR